MWTIRTTTNYKLNNNQLTGSTLISRLCLCLTKPLSLAEKWVERATRWRRGNIISALSTFWDSLPWTQRSVRSHGRRNFCKHFVVGIKFWKLSKVSPHCCCCCTPVGLGWAGGLGWARLGWIGLTCSTTIGSENFKSRFHDIFAAGCF